jgi:GMP synthase (glutamine-hydrolysing)
MKPVLVLQHVCHESLGSLGAYFRDAGLPCRHIEVFQEIPDRLDVAGAAGLVVLGGPMNVDEVDRYPFLRDEVAWIHEALSAEMPVLGICLGAQLLAKSLGSRVYAGATKEVGWYEVELTPAAAGDPLFAGSHTREVVFQWHGDTFDLPPGAVHLAQSGQCLHQAFRYGRAAYGLQFHVEMTAELLDDWLDDPGNQRELASLPEIDASAIRAQTPHYLPRMQALGNRLLPRFAAMCCTLS